MGLVTDQVWRHSLEDSVTYKDEDFVEWVHKVWITETNDPNATAQNVYFIRGRGFKTEGNISIKKASGSTGPEDAANIAISNGYNEGDTIQITGSYDTDDGGAQNHPFDFTVVVPGAMTAREVSGLIINAFNANSGSVVSGTIVTADNARPNYDCEVTVWANDVNPYFGTGVTLSTLVYTPNPPPIPPMA